jgi:glycosyltransferase involved in cell wall biosynthesis
MKDLRIVIPAYNEEDGIGDTLNRVLKACPGAEVIVVDDGSYDGTGSIAREMGVLVIRNEKNKGKGGATKVGLSYDTGRENAYLAFIDADSTYPPESFPQMYEKCKANGYNLVVGARLNKMDTGMPKFRRLGNAIFAGLLSFYSGSRTTDTSTGQRIFRKDLLSLLDGTPDGLDFDTCMTVEVLFRKMAYTEVPIQYFPRKGRSKLSSFRDGYCFLRIIMNATRKYRPVLFFCTLGIPFVILEWLMQVFTKMFQRKSRPLG